MTSYYDYREKLPWLKQVEEGIELSDRKGVICRYSYEELKDPDVMFRLIEDSRTEIDMLRHNYYMGYKDSYMVIFSDINDHEYYKSETFEENLDALVHLLEKANEFGLKIDHQYYQDRIFPVMVYFKDETHALIMWDQIYPQFNPKINRKRRGNW